MIFDKIRLVGSPNVDLPLRGAQPTDPYIVKDVDGLGPSEIDLVIKAPLHGDSIAKVIRPRNKEFDILVRLNPNYSINQTPGDLRDRVYAFLAPVANRAIKMQLMSGPNVVAQIEGFLGRVIPNPFSKDPEIQINIRCTQSYFTAPAEVYMDMQAFFPNAGVEFQLPAVIGSAPTPFTFTGRLLNTTHILRMFHKNYNFPGDMFELPAPMQGGFAAGTNITVKGGPGPKYAVYWQDGQEYTSMIGALGARSVWLNLYPGINTLVFSEPIKITALYYRPKYQGV